MYHRLVLSLIAAATLSFGTGADVFAQGQAIDGIIEGVRPRRSPRTRPVTGATVRAFNAGTGYERSVVSDESGRYGLPLMPPGEYVVFVEAPTFATMSRTGVVLRAGQVLTVEFAMSSSSFAETVQVTAEQPTVEVGRTVQSNTYDERTVRAMPTIGRSILDFFVLQPGVNAPPISSGGSGTGTPSTVYGGLGLRQMNVDGVSNNLQGGARNLVITQEAVQEFQTVTNFSAEFGRVAGGLQNAFTRSGSNAMHGSAYLFTRQDWLSARPFLLAPTAPEAGVRALQLRRHGGRARGPRRVVLLRELRALVAGPAGRLDHHAGECGGCWAFPPTSIGAYTTTFRAHTLTARNDTQLTPTHRLSFRYNYYYDRESPLNGGLISREVSHALRREPVLLHRAARVGARPDGRQRGAVPVRHAQHRERRLGRSRCAEHRRQRRRQLQRQRQRHAHDPEKGIHIVDNLTWTAGRHVVKAGFDLLPVSFRERTTNINGSFVFGGLPAVAGVRGAVTPLDQFLLTEQRRHRSGDRPAVLVFALHAVDRRRVLRGHDVQPGLLHPGRLPPERSAEAEPRPALRVLRASGGQSQPGPAADRDVPDRHQQLRAAARPGLRSDRQRPHRDSRRRRALLQRRRRADLQHLPARQRPRRGQRQRDADHARRAGVLARQGDAADRRQRRLRRARDGRGLRGHPGRQLVRHLGAGAGAQPGDVADLSGQPGVATCRWRST